MAVQRFEPTKLRLYTRSLPTAQTGIPNLDHLTTGYIYNYINVQVVTFTEFTE
jgi:hypothetical protein